MTGLTGFGAEQAALLIGLLAQLASLVVVGWMLLRIDRRIEEGQSVATAHADRSARALEAMRETQRAMLVAADGVTNASRAWAHMPPPATEDHFRTLMAALDGLRGAPALAAAGEPPAAAAPDARESERALLRERRLRGQLEGEVTELRRRLEDQTRQVGDLQRDRRQQANDSARVAGLEATNGRLMAELKDCRRESRQLQATLQPMSLELKSLRTQIQQSVGGGKPREDGARVYLDRIQELERRGQELEDALASLKLEHLRTQQEKLFIEEHYLDLANG